MTPRPPKASARHNPEPLVLGNRDIAAFVAGLLDLPPVNARRRDTRHRYRVLVLPAGDDTA